MTYSQGDSTKPVQGQAGEECPVPPPDCKIEPCGTEYECKIPDDVKEELEAKLNSDKLAADDVYAEAEQKAGDVKATAKSTFDLEIAKYESAKKFLGTKTGNAKEKLSAAYNKCLKDSRPKNCESDDNVPQDKKAICVVTLKRDLSTKNKEFMEEMQKIEETKSKAEADWSKAQSDHNIVICLASAVREEAYNKAEVEFRTALSEAFGEVCG